jgi:plasmid stability protein
LGQLLVRKVDDDLIRRLKQRAAAAGRSVEAEHRALLEAALRPSAVDFAERARQLRARSRGRKTTDSAELIRADRDRDHSEGGEDARS